MNYFRTFLDSFRERVTSLTDYISTLVFGESSISDDEVHKPLLNSTETDKTDKTVESNQSDQTSQSDATAPNRTVGREGGSDNEEFYYRCMYRMYLNMTKVVKYRRWTFAEYRAVLTNFKIELEV